MKLSPQAHVVAAGRTEGKAAADMLLEAVQSKGVPSEHLVKETESVQAAKAILGAKSDTAHAPKQLSKAELRKACDR